MTRKRLPNRRRSETTTIHFRRRAYILTVGFDQDGRARETFVDPEAAAGSDTALELADAAVLISILLQHGETPAALARSLSQVPEIQDGQLVTRPGSAAGAILAALAAIPDLPPGSGHPIERIPT